MKIKVSKNGPYVVSGKVPLVREKMIFDETDEPLEWKEVKKFKEEENYCLCRCGKSKTKPFCDWTHSKSGFDGSETASPDEKFEEGMEIVNGPELILRDKEKLCASAGFCHRKGGTWFLAEQSDNPSAKKIAIQQACDCPSGRLVIVDKKTGKIIETERPCSISVVEHRTNLSGPLWVKGFIPVESCEGKEYEKRNRVTLCRCGKSKNKPFCDGTHIEANFNDSSVT